jgi:competence ComEA-like helix-hairpin-helix protein
MCDASVREMAAVDIAIKKVLFSQHGVESGVDELTKIEEEKNKLELELEITKKMYERVLNLLVEERVTRDMKNTSVPEPEVIIPEPIEVDVELLKAQMSTPNDQEISPVEFKAKKRNPQYETKAAAQLKERMDAAKREMVGKKANINTATAEELMGAAGMGIGMARTIVKRRRDFGPYKDVSDLLDIHQLSDKMFVKYEPFLEV